MHSNVYGKRSRRCMDAHWHTFDISCVHEMLQAFLFTPILFNANIWAIRIEVHKNDSFIFLRITSKVYIYVCVYEYNAFLSCSCEIESTFWERQLRKSPLYVHMYLHTYQLVSIAIYSTNLRWLLINWLWVCNDFLRQWCKTLYSCILILFIDMAFRIYFECNVISWK